MDRIDDRAYYTPPPMYAWNEPQGCPDHGVKSLEVCEPFGLKQHFDPFWFCKVWDCTWQEEAHMEEA
jgi:hypothetical protein